MPGLQLTDHLRGVGAGVFDVLRFVEHHKVPFRFEPAFAVALQQRVRRDHDVVLVHGIGHVVTVFAVQHQRAQFRTKARGLALPVAHQADRGDDKRRSGESPGVFFNLNMHQRLQGFAQAHVVGEYAVETVLTQKLQPVQTLLLIGSQTGDYAWRHGNDRQFGSAAELLQHGAQGFRAFPHRALAQRYARAQCIEPRELEAVTGKIVLAVADQFEQRGHPRFERFGGQANKTTALRRMYVDERRQAGQAGCRVRRTGGGLRQQLGQPRQNVAALAVDFHAQRQIKPR